MTQLKMDGKLGASATAALEKWSKVLYDRPGLRIVGVVEMVHMERVQPGPDSDHEPSVKVRITHLEVPNAEQENLIREVMRALYAQRTAVGTIDEDGTFRLSEETLRRTGGLLHAVEAARCKAGVQHWEAYVRSVRHQDLTISELRHELDAISAGLAALLQPEPKDDEG